MYSPLETEIIGYARAAEYHDLTARLRMLRMVEDGQRTRTPRHAYKAMLQRFAAAMLERPRRAFHTNASRG